jgi:hypothetical protein
VTRPVRAMQVWQILIATAHNRQILTYKQLSKLLGFQGAGVLAQILGLIMEYCKTNKLPPLTCLVVAEKTGVPGTGLSTLTNLPVDREQVFTHNWYGRFPVQISDF